MKSSPQPSKISLRQQFALNLRAIRTQQGLSQEKLGELAGFHRSYVSQAERALGNITLDNVERLAKVLMIDASKLLKKTKSKDE